MEVKAPGVLKLLGEHASVYGRTAIAIAVNVYTYADIKKIPGKSLKIILPDFGGLECELDGSTLAQLHAIYKAKYSMDAYINAAAIDPRILPYATIAARLYGEFGAKLEGVQLTVKSEIPMQSGMASSGACSAAATVALINASKIKLKHETAIDVARDGERVVHKNQNAGGIDVSTSYYGGYVSINPLVGAKKENINAKLDLLLVNTGPKKSTAETVGHVAEQHRDNKARVEAILDKIHECSGKGLESLKKEDMQTLGACMYQDHELLRSLEVSSDSLDKAVAIAKSHKAHGAKLSGGGGGGIAIVLKSDPESDALRRELQSQGFVVSGINTSMEGAFNYLSSK